MTALLERGFVDTFRLLHPDERDPATAGGAICSAAAKGTSGGALTIFW